MVFVIMAQSGDSDAMDLNDSSLISGDDSETKRTGQQLTIRSMTKTFDYGEIVAAEDINLTINSDEFVVLLGPSGCGKTTILRCIAGLEHPNDGQIMLGDEDITYAAPKDRDLAYVFQSITLFPHMSVRENIRFGLDMATDLDGVAKEDRVQRVSKILGIHDYLDRSPTALSGGQQQRVSIGRAMVMEPSAFLLDEPFSALDANLRDQMQTEVKKLQRQLERAMIFVTHDQAEAMKLADKIVVMRDGQIQQVGSPYEIHNDPANLFVARFIGSPPTNVIDGQIEKRDDGHYLATEAFTLSVNDDVFSNHAGETVSMGIRPDYLAVSPENVDRLIVEDAMVTLVEPEGSRDTVFLDANGVEMRASVSQGTIESQSVVDIGFSNEDAWFFDDTGERIR